MLAGSHANETDGWADGTRVRQDREDNAAWSTCGGGAGPQVDGPAFGRARITSVIAAGGEDECGFPCKQVGTFGETYLFGIYHPPENALCLS